MYLAEINCTKYWARRGQSARQIVFLSLHWITCLNDWILALLPVEDNDVAYVSLLGPVPTNMRLSRKVFAARFQLYSLTNVM